MKSYSAVIFDMDGVIVDSEPRHEQAFLDIFDQLGYTDNHGIHFPNYIGRSDRAVWLDFMAAHRPHHSIEELTMLKQKRFLEILQEDQPIFDGLPDLVAKLAPKYPLAVASGSLHPVIDEVLALKSLRRFFPVVVSIQDVAKGKPAPDVFLRAAKLLKVEPKECVVIEDSVAGVEAGLAAGMTVIGITNSFPAEKLSNAHHVVKTYEEIERLLL
ncbi:MAG TPA: HAD family phosphatase [Roseimicrobium sp.]|nr:HAD family phosphatase [Roseimicrobium sp.]